jgi:4-hydroxythreonine-4-phosphate dehydrogenase
VKRIIITTGDADGIGTEVAAKALKKIGALKKFHFILIRSANTPKSHLKIIDSTFSRQKFSDLGAALAYSPKNAKEISDVELGGEPPSWVYAAAKACKEGQAQALATAPMSKKMHNGRPQGHTEILKEVSGADSGFMTFLGSEFNVLTLTGHVPHHLVSQNLLTTKVIAAATLLSDFKKTLPKLAKKPLALVGLNPHAGEGGLIGNEEISVLAPALKTLREKGIAIDGPLVPDSAFLRPNHKKYSFFICPYHDQALIPFKMIHGQDMGVHMTLGLPFVRTSVDHGTAKDIFNKNKANPGSMIDAIKWAMQLA